MDGLKVKALKQAILDLPVELQQELAEEILPLLLTTRAGIKGIDRVFRPSPMRSLMPSSNVAGAGPRTYRKKLLPR